MRELKIKEKAGSLTITHKLSKQEQVNPMELDIVQKREIPTLLPIQLISSFSGSSCALPSPRRFGSSTT